ncbi:MAG: hypothetical protein ACI9FO_001285 [Methylophagaceae bacterium]|jgi:hypothetical protein
MVRTSPNVLPMHPESEEVLDIPEHHRNEDNVHNNVN